MMIVPQNPTYAYVGAFIDELARAGVGDVVICPGSRSTPLTLTFAAEERIRKWVLVDERSAAFFALGIAKRSGMPVALVCTSGTAAANFYPAVCEAQQSRVPLLILTTDRPPELQEVGAPQTMGQKYLFGSHVKWFAEMALPEANPALLRYSRRMALRAVDMSLSVPKGPVHLNFPFREPLVNIAMDMGVVSGKDETATQGRTDHLPLTWVERDAPHVPLVYAEGNASQLSRYSRGLIVIGPRENRSPIGDGFEGAVQKLAETLQFPILADPLSQLRREPHPLVIDNYEAFLRDKTMVDMLHPEIILRFGAMPTSKPLLQYLQTYPDIDHILVDDSNEWRDPAFIVSTIIRADEFYFIHEVSQHLVPREPSEWAKRWQTTYKITQSVLSDEVLQFEDLFEGRVFTELALLLPKFSTLVVGNSMPIRDCDTFFSATQNSITVLGNRGVNGIDGMVSTALGISSTYKGTWMEKPTVLVVGDLTFYHDLNGLLAAKKYRLNLTIVVINNDGGGIFSFLPQAEHHPDHFEEYFGTPTGLDFRLVTEMYGGTFTRITNWEHFRAAVTTGITERGLHIVEVPTNRESNVAMHRHLWKKVSEALTAVISDK